MCKKILNTILLSLAALLFLCPAAFAQDKGKNEVPPKEYIKTLQKEADAAVQIHLEKITLDSCKNCTSTGQLYVVEGSVKKVYFDKSKKIKGTTIVYLSAADRSLYNDAGDFIVFLNKIPARNLEAYRSVAWTARQATEFRYAQKLESYISQNQKK